MKPITLTLNGRTLPCSPTMGAALLFTERTGKEVGEADLTTIKDLMPYLWACIEVGCRREHQKLELTYQEFCDETSAAELVEWRAQLESMLNDELKKKAEKKKTPSR